jgi:hypothetical protein
MAAEGPKYMTDSSEMAPAVRSIGHHVRVTAGCTVATAGTIRRGGTLPTCQGRSQAPCRCGVWAATERRRRSLWRVREAAGGRWGAAGCLLGAATKMHRQPRGGDGAAVTS